jgi:hypothetical protein
VFTEPFIEIVGMAGVVAAIGTAKDVNPEGHYEFLWGRKGRSWFDRLTTNGNEGCSWFDRLTTYGNKGRSWFDRLTTNGNKITTNGNEGRAWFDKLTANGNEGCSWFDKLTTNGMNSITNVIAETALTISLESFSAPPRSRRPARRFPP